MSKNAQQENPTKYIGLTVLDFPILAICFNKVPAVVGDMLADFQSWEKFKKDSIEGKPAHTSIALGLLGVKIPIKK